MADEINEVHPDGNGADENPGTGAGESIIEEASGSGIPDGGRPDRKAYIISETKEWIKSIAIAIVIAVVFKATMVQSYAVPTGSMIPTIMPNDRVFGNRFVYYFREPKPGDVISFTPPESVPTRQKTRFGTYIPFLKRVIAVHGDAIEVKDGKVFVNGKKIDEPYINDPPDYYMTPTVVPEGMFFVLGDNRQNSLDSHVWGFLPEKNVKAKAFFRYWPLNRIGVVK